MRRLLLALPLLLLLFSQPVFAVPAGTAFNYQGTVTYQGSPANGNFNWDLRLFDALSGGNQVAFMPIFIATAANGLVQFPLNFGNQAFLGDARWLEIRLKRTSDVSYTLLTPRIELRPVPYAIGLSPGATINSPDVAKHGVLFKVRNFDTVSDSASGIFGQAMSPSGYGVGGRSLTQFGVGVWGDNTYGNDNAPPSYGVLGTSTWGIGVRGSGTQVGVQAQSNGYIFEGYGADANDVEFSVGAGGDVFADGTYNSPAADFAEMLPARDGLEPGDVIVIGSDGKLERSTRANQPSVAGVHATKPAFLGGMEDGADRTGKIPLAIMGIVPVRATSANGAIRPGDLLVTSSLPGHAMRAGQNRTAGSVLGKALEALPRGTGKIRMLVSLQ